MEETSTRSQQPIHFIFAGVLIIAGIFWFTVLRKPASAPPEQTPTPDTEQVSTTSATSETLLPAVDPLAVEGNIITAGSSTTYPITERMADRFTSAGFPSTITVDSIGTGAGMDRFCVSAETDIANASRPIKPEELTACQENGREPLEFQVAIDALTVVVSRENTFVESLTLDQLEVIYSGVAQSWNDVDPSYPDEPIQLFSPGTDSGTFDYFIETIFESEAGPILSAPGIQLSEDDNVLVQGVLGSQYAIGYFGYAYYQENQSTLRALAIEGVAPSEETSRAGEYPLSRPLFLYTTAEIMQSKPQVSAFMNFTLQHVAEELGGQAGQIGYIPVDDAVQQANEQKWIEAQQ